MFKNSLQKKNTRDHLSSRTKKKTKGKTKKSLSVSPLKQSLSKIESSVIA